MQNTTLARIATAAVLLIAASVDALSRKRAVATGRA